MALRLRDWWTGLVGGSLAKRTTIYVAGFGLGTMALTGLLAFSVTRIAHAVLPSSRETDSVEPGSIVEPVVTAAPRLPRSPALNPGRRRPAAPRPAQSAPTDPADPPSGPTEPTLSLPEGIDSPTDRSQTDPLTKRSRANDARPATRELPL